MLLSLVEQALTEAVTVGLEPEREGMRFRAYDS